LSVNNTGLRKGDPDFLGVETVFLNFVLINVSQSFFARCPTLSFIYLCDPSPFLDTVTYEIKLLYFHIVDLYIRIHIYITFIFNILLLLNILFRYNTLFTYTSKNILLIMGIIFSVFLGPDEHLQVFDCPVAV
jgi:hypothetical protein